MGYHFIIIAILGISASFPRFTLDTRDAVFRKLGEAVHKQVYVLI